MGTILYCVTLYLDLVCCALENECSTQKKSVEFITPFCGYRNRILSLQVLRCSNIAVVKVTEITELIKKALENDSNARLVCRSYLKW